MPPLQKLLFAEGLAVGALVHSGVCLMGTYQDPLQGAVVGILTVVGTLRNSALDTFVCMAAHSQFLLDKRFSHSMSPNRAIMRCDMSKTYLQFFLILI